MLRLITCMFLPFAIITAISCSTPNIENNNDTVEKEVIIMDNSSLNGNFTFLTFTNDKPACWAGYGDVIFDGNGNGAYSIISSTTHIKDSSFTYSVNKDGRAKFTFDGSDNLGMLGLKKDIFTIIDTDNSDKQIKITVGIKKSSEIYNSDILGDYIYVSYYNHYKPTNWCSYGTMTFDGKGGGTFQDSATSEFDLRNGNISYNVETNGVFSYRLKSINYGYTKEKREGIVCKDKNVIITVNTSIADILIGFEITIKTSSEMNNSSLQGEYIIASYSNLNSKPLTTYGKMIFDGKGNATYSDIKNSNNTLQANKFTYSVESDGKFTMETLSKEIIRGIISKDTNIMTFVDTDISDKHISLNIGLKSNL